MRDKGIDSLRAICALLIVFLHTGFAVGNVKGELISSIATSAVGVFFVISGFLYNPEKDEKQQVLRLIKITAFASMLYFFYTFISLKSIYAIVELFSCKNILNFLLYNNPIFGGHLWYLFSYIYVLFIAHFLKRRLKQGVFIAIILLVVGVSIGVYSPVTLGNPLPAYISRNFIFEGLPFFTIGYYLQQKITKLDKKVCLFGVVGMLILSLLECRLFICAFGLPHMHDLYYSSILLVPFAFAFGHYYLNFDSPLEKIGGGTA